MPLIESEPDALARVYASSLYELAEAAGGKENAQEILGELEAVLEMARGDASFSEFLATRVLAASDRDASIVKIFEGKASELTVKFMRLLNKKGRLGHLPAVTRAFEELVQKAFGRVEVDVFTAEKLDEAGLGSIREKVQSALGHDVVLHSYVEPSMLGGVKLRIGDRLIDDSLATQLRRVEGRLRDEGGSAIRSRASQIIEGA